MWRFCWEREDDWRVLSWDWRDCFWWWSWVRDWERLARDFWEFWMVEVRLWVLVEIWAILERRDSFLVWI